VSARVDDGEHADRVQTDDDRMSADGIIPDAWQVPPRFRHRVGLGAGRQRAMVDDGHLLLILHDVPEAGVTERTPRVFWRKPDGVWSSDVRAHLDRFRGVVHALDERVDRTSDVDELFQIIRSATPLFRTVRHMHAAFQQAREGVDDVELITLRDAAGDLERAADLTLQDAKNALEHAQAKLAQKMNDAQHRLNLLAALFFPVTAIASVVGNAMHTGLEDLHPAAYWVIIAAAFVVGFFLRGRLTK
jgi:Mg2+ and Co2+ transporter CorA